MTPQNNRPSGNRRRGQSGRNRRNNRAPGAERAAAPTPNRPARPKSFLEKVVAFLKGSPRPAPARRQTLASQPAQTHDDRPVRQRGSKSDEPKRRPSRKPELVEVTSPKLYVGNLSFEATESDLSELFNGVGSVQTAEVVSHRDTQRSKGFAFVTMTSVEEAQRAVTELHDKEFMGRKLVVSGAKTSDVRSYTPTER